MSKWISFLLTYIGFNGCGYFLTVFADKATEQLLHEIVLTLIFGLLLTFNIKQVRHDTNR